MSQNFTRRDFPPKPSRTELQERIDQGEQPRTILEELYREMQVPLYSLAYGSLRDVGRAEDFVQTVFLKMHLSFESMIAREPVRAWIIRVAKNALVDEYRHDLTSGGGELPADFEVLEHNLVGRSWTNRFEEQVDTWVGLVEPMLAYLKAIVAKGWLRSADLEAYWRGVGEGVTQRELAAEYHITQGRISQLKSQVKLHVCAALYYCEILGIVRFPHRETEIRAHLDLVELAASLTAQDRALLRDAGGAVRLDRLDLPVLLPEDASAAIQDPKSGREVTLHELHEAESKYAAAIPNPTPHCIQSPCPIHAAPAHLTEGGRR